MTRKAIFDLVKASGGKFPDQASVDDLDAALDRLGVPRDGMVRKISDKGVALIKEFEGLRLKAYPDPATGGDPWTIGVGHTGSDVKPGLVITEAQADDLLRKDVARFERAVNKLAPITTQDQFDALVSLAFNVGEENLRSSTLLRMHNAGNHDGAANQFARWNKAAGRVMTGLTRRRTAETKLYRGAA
ncbi:lysozyme [Allosphingosinicella flava]|uniref:Lysozyme n=1 Tax=Allosphingosinicella flava TaxID=2771430 RepID=A0A7T2GKL9_9SPHN|nr:lysozyme [Sphingosinicella flava]QPQ55606.1 lysozyme [Sphingosinicella flava]